MVNISQSTARWLKMLFTKPLIPCCELAEPSLGKPSHYYFNSPLETSRC